MIPLIRYTSMANDEKPVCFYPKYDISTLGLYRITFTITL